MRRGIAIAGNLIVDYVKEIDSYPSQGMLSNISSVQQSVGGCVTNTIIDLAKIDSDIELFALGMVGNDSNGEYIRDVLQKLNIDILGVKINGEAVTSFTDVMTSEDGEVRTFFHARGANAEFDITDIDFPKITSRFFHIGYALLLDRFDAPDEEYGTVMAKTLAKAKQHGMITSLDVVSENSKRFKKIVSPCLKYCDNLIINEVEASMICEMPVRKEGKLDEGYMRNICSKLISCGVNERVIIHAPEASCGMSRKEDFELSPSFLLPKGFIKGSVGAGDAFCAGALYAIYKGFGIKDILLIGAAAAVCSLSELNSIDGMKSIEEVLEIVNKYPHRTLCDLAPQNCTNR
jgi:sugar/nucleoside kinase (ribokinase family)